MSHDVGIAAPESIAEDTCMLLEPSALLLDGDVLELGIVPLTEAGVLNDASPSHSSMSCLPSCEMIQTSKT